MYADFDELRDLGFEFEDVDVVRLDEDRYCHFCLGEPAPLGHNSGANLSDWLAASAGKLGQLFRSTERTYESDLQISVPATKSKFTLNERDLRCLTCDSQISQTMGIPKQFLIPLLGQLSERQVLFLQRYFLMNICGVCRFSELAERDTADTIYARLVNTRFAGQESLLRSSDPDGACDEIMGLLQGLRLSRGA